MEGSSSDDEPWFTDQLKRLDRKVKREFNKNRNSPKYKKLKKSFFKKMDNEKRKFKKDMIDNVMTAKDGQWYTQLKRITNFGQNKSELTQVDEISHLSDQDQAEAIADSFSSISNEYESVKKDDITVPPFSDSSIPQFKPHQIRKYLQKIKTNKSTAPGDIPAKIIKDFSLFLCIPMASIINTGLRVGHWPKS